MESASDDLKLGLQMMKLASERDLMNCRSRVRRLSNGLPAFDSVWIDALVEKNLLTPFQAQFFEEKRWGELQIGQEYVLQRQIHFDRIMPMFRAVHSESSATFFVSRLPFDQTNSSEGLKRLSRLTGKLTSENTELSSPVDLHVNSKRGVVEVISPCVEGEPLDRLLIRRGRFPEEVVRALTIEICKILQSHHPLLLHGDLRLANVMISTTGKVSLLNAGVLNALTPRLNIHQALPETAYDGIAPERFESAPEVTIASELYALGCLLWQLLAGRPPHAVADPLAKIAAHRQKEIQDIREISPECSEDFATLIQKLTCRRVLNRPNSFGQILESISIKKQNSQVRLREFLQSFESSAPHQRGAYSPPKRSSGLKAAVMIILTLLGIGVIWNRDQFGLPNLSQLSAATLHSPIDKISPEDFKAISEPDAPHQSESINPDEATQVTSIPLPEPNSDGIIELNASVPYHLSSIRSSGLLTIRGASETGSTLILAAGEHELVAPYLRIENVNLEFHDAENDEPATLRVLAQELHLVACQFKMAGASQQASSEAMIDWQTPLPENANAGRLLVSHCVNSASRTVIAAKSPVSTILIQNVLQQGVSPLFILESGAKAGLLVPIVLNQYTQSASAPVMQIHLNKQFSQGGKISLQGNHSIISTTSKLPVIGFTDVENSATDWQSKFEIAAQSLIVDRDAMLFGVTADGVKWTAIDSGKIAIDGVVSGKFHLDVVVGTAQDPNAISVPRFLFDDLPVRATTNAPGFVLEQFKQARNFP